MDPTDSDLAEALAGLIALSKKYVESYHEESANAHHNVAPYYGHRIDDYEYEDNEKLLSGNGDQNCLLEEGPGFDDEYEYEVDKIVDYMNIDGCDYYLVHWKGYGIKGRTWEPYNHLMNAPKKIDEFFQRRFWKQNNCSL